MTAIQAFGSFMLSIWQGLKSVPFFDFGFSFLGFLVGSYIVILCVNALGSILGVTSNLQMEDKKRSE